MKNIQTWVIVGLAVVIILMLLFDRDPPSYDTTQWKDSISKANDRIVTLQGERAKLSQKIAEDSILQAEEKQAYQNSIKGLQARLKEKRIRVDSILIDRPEVKEFISMQDSVISMQAVRIDILQNNLSELRVDLSQIQNNFLKQIEAHESKLKATEELANQYKQDTRREKRKVKVWRVATIVGSVGMFLLGSQ